MKLQKFKKYQFNVNEVIYTNKNERKNEPLDALFLSWKLHEVAEAFLKWTREERVWEIAEVLF